MKNHEKVADLIKQLKEAGVNLSEILPDDKSKSISDVKKNGISDDLIDKLKNAEAQEFELFAAWSKSF
jgi:hypothetical protein